MSNIIRVQRIHVTMTLSLTLYLALFPASVSVSIPKTNAGTITSGKTLYFVCLDC